MNALFAVALLCLFSPSALAAGYDCTGAGVQATLAKDERSLRVVVSGSSRNYRIVSKTSRTGDSDQTFDTGRGCKLTIDEQYGDSLELDGREIPVSCQLL